MWAQDRAQELEGSTLAALSAAASRSWFFLAAVSPAMGRQMSHKYNPTSSPPISHLFTPQLSLPRLSEKKKKKKKKKVCRTCKTSAVNNSVPPKVNFQFAQWRVTITLWPANCISPLIPYHFISGSLCSLNWGWLYLVVAICLLFSRCLDVQPDCIREWEGQQENGTTWPW